MFTASGYSCLAVAWHIPSMIQKCFCETVAEVMDAEVEGEDEIHPSAEQVPFHVPPEVEPQKRDFDVNEFFRSSPNPVVATILGGSEEVQRAAVRRGYPVMISWFLNFGDDIHDLSFRERITATVQRIPSRLLILAFTSRVWSPILNYATSPLVRERIDRERAAELAIWTGWLPCANYKRRPAICFLWKILRGPRAGTNHQFGDFGVLSLCLRISHICSCLGSRIRGAEEPSRDPSDT